MPTKTMLTTVDNPWDPFIDFDAWYSFDMACGYNTLGLLARIAQTSNELSDKDYDQEIQKAIEEIALINASGLHKKISKNV